MFLHLKGIVEYLVTMFNDFMVNSCGRTYFGQKIDFLNIIDFFLKSISSIMIGVIETVIAVIRTVIAAPWPVIALIEADFQHRPKISHFKFLYKHHQIAIP